MAAAVTGARPGGASATPGPGLASNHQTATTEALPDEAPKGSGCPHRRGMVYLNLDTGESRPARCGRLSCDYCATRNAWRRSAAILLARPQRAILLTQVAAADDPDPWQVAR